MKNTVKTPFKQRLKVWWEFRKKMFWLWWANAPATQKNVERGNYYIRKGCPFQVGQPFKIRDTHSGKIKTRYIENIFFNFKLNQITHKFSDKPIPGLTEKFIKPKKVKFGIKD